MSWTTPICSFQNNRYNFRSIPSSLAGGIMGPIEVLDFFKFILCLAGVFILALAIRSFTRTYDPRYREAMVFWDLLNKKIDEYLDERVIPLSEWEELRKMAEFA